VVGPTKRQPRLFKALDSALDSGVWPRAPRVARSSVVGRLSGGGSVIADLRARLWRAVQAGDPAEARRINERIQPTAEVFYAEPWVDMHNRMKEALVLLGKLPRAVVRPPLARIPAAEVERIRRALVAAGLLQDSARAQKVA